MIIFTGVSSDNIFQCTCGPGFYMNTKTLHCDICPRGMFCTGYQNTPETCPSNTFSNEAAKSMQECLCTGDNMVYFFDSDSMHCVCNTAYTLNTTSGKCVRCPKHPIETTFSPGGLCMCSPGYFVPNSANLNTFAMYNLSRVSSIDHPLSVLHRRALFFYLKEYPWLSIDKLQQNTVVDSCTLCPPNFYCTGGNNAVTYNEITNISTYTPFMAGAHTKDTWVRFVYLRVCTFRLFNYFM